jgi:hypothetical protein
LDQNVATVGRDVITLHDVRLESRISHSLDKGASAMNQQQVVVELVRRSMISQYLNNIGILLEPSREEMANLKKALTESQLQTKEVERLLKDRLRTKLFVDRQIASRITVTDQDVLAYYRSEKDKKFIGKTLEQVESIAREDLRKERTEKEFQKWLDTEMRRTEIALFPLPN